MSVRWVKSVPAFRCLTDADQRVLLQNGWRDLFLLTAAQFSSAVDLRPPVASPSCLPGQQSTVLYAWRGDVVIETHMTVVSDIAHENAPKSAEYLYYCHPSLCVILSKMFQLMLICSYVPVN